MTTEREAFEAWKNSGLFMSRNNTPGSNLDAYQDSCTQGQWESWQASRKQALEDAAKLCDFERLVIAGNRSSEYIDTHNKACNDCMAMIRSFK